jgi:hypothetical protein
LRVALFGIASTYVILRIARLERQSNRPPFDKSFSYSFNVAQANHVIIVMLMEQEQTVEGWDMEADKVVQRLEYIESRMYDALQMR